MNTDIAKYYNAEDPRTIISSWMSSYFTMDFLAMWETLYNTNFTVWNFIRLEMSPEDWL